MRPVPYSYVDEMGTRRNRTEPSSLDSLRILAVGGLEGCAFHCACHCAAGSRVTGAPRVGIPHVYVCFCKLLRDPRGTFCSGLLLRRRDQFSPAPRPPPRLPGPGEGGGSNSACAPLCVGLCVPGSHFGSSLLLELALPLPALRKPASQPVVRYHSAFISACRGVYLWCVCVCLGSIAAVSCVSVAS